MSNLNEVQMLEGRKIELDEKRKYIVETGTREQQAAQLREMLDTAKFELDDRQARLDELTRDIQLLSTQLTNAASDLAEKRSAREAALIRTRNLESRKNMLEQLARNPFNSQAGVRAVMEHRQALSGIIGVVGQMIKVENGYEEAISTALGGLMNEIITKDEQSARDAIRFLYRNQSGRARFRPVTTCQPRRISRENLIICQNTEGFLGPASQFVSCEERIQPVVDSYLGNVPVVKDLETGNSLYHLTGGAYQIVTLTGEVIHRGGSMTGGRLRGNNANIVTMHKELEDVKAAYDAAQAEVSLKIKETDRADALVRKTTETLQNRRYAAASLEPIVDAKKAKYEKLRAEYSLLDTEEDTAADETHIDELVVELNKAYQRRDTLTTEIRSKRDQRMSMMQDNERKEAQLRQSRKDLSTAEASANAVRIDQTRLETKLENAVSRLSSEYRMTYEFAKSKEIDEPVENAREEVARLREEIMRLGKINENAPEEYNEVNGRYETLKGQIAELTASRDKILKAIDEMDQVMTKQFMEMFAAINKEFDVIFRHLYGGGKAMLVLQDPSDILNCGIDINAQPPGKAVQNNMLFSGGEKSLIALCVLFAILKVKPVPLVILDEVEAALDPGNVERFAQYLHNYTHQTQFIIVTHRPGTMENADVLYGVTMQQQGVSQMLKVELREAISMAEPTPTEVSNGVS
ncbi:MAG: AAA family ATPase, partial [Solobacterium sp.]|nr:AAA family ATPase [Solobacterium sp.]